jgi:hypothetical protein
LVIREKNAHGWVVVVVCMADLIVLLLGTWRNVTGQVVIAAFVSTYFLLLGSYACIESTFFISRRPARLQIRRRLGRLAIRQEYSLDAIQEVFELKTVRGNSLKMRLHNGGTKRLTLFGEFKSLDCHVSAMNHFLQSIRNRHHG